MLDAVENILIGLAGGYSLLSLAAFTFQDRLLYFPDSQRPDPAQHGVPDMAPVELHTADGLRLNAWYKPGRPTLVVLHGNGGHIGDRGPRVRPWLDAGLGVLLVEWRGYGGNPGRPCEAGFMDDGRAALAFLAAQGIAPEHTILLGESLGTAIAVKLAAERKVGAVVLVAPYTSVADVGAMHYFFLPVRLLIRDRFDALAVAPKVRAPVLVVHGEADEVIPPRFGQTLFDAFTAPKQLCLIPQAGHDNLGRFGMHAMVTAFLARHEAAAQARA